MDAKGPRSPTNTQNCLNEVKPVHMESGLGETEMANAFHQAEGQWTGCDWPTQFGKSGLNLSGLTAAQALLLARATAGQEAADWHAAVAWLTQIEYDAATAAALAQTALDLERQGQFVVALVHAQRACSLERKYHSRLVWQPLLDRIRTALAEPEAASTEIPKEVSPVRIDTTHR